MSLIVEAIYENGVLKPAHPLPLKEHALLHAVVRAARGEVPGTAEALAAVPGVDGEAGRAALYADPDLGPLLRGDRLRAVRAKYPEPKPE